MIPRQFLESQLLSREKIQSLNQRGANGLHHRGPWIARSLFGSNPPVNIYISLTVLLLGGLTQHKPALSQPFPTDDRPPSVEFTSPVAEGVAVDEAYLLGAGDSLRIDVFNIPDYSGEVRVLAGGVVNLPVVGPIDVEGLTLQQASDRIAQQLTPFVRRPRVTLSLLAARPLQVAIAGEVQRPGAYRIPLEDPVSGTSTVTQAIEIAGGITQLADIRQIQIKRRLPKGSAAVPFGKLPNTSTADGFDGEQPYQIVSVDLWSLLRGEGLNQDLRLQNGDTILVPTATALNADELTELASASFSPDQMTVNVVGEVDNPGPIRVPPNTPLNQAILAAGSFNNRAKVKRVNLIRLNPNGTVTEREIEVDFSQGAGEDINPTLRPNDTIVVRRSILASVGDAVGSVLGPASRIFNILRIFGL